MRVVKREFKGVMRSDVFRVLPIGDVHIGSAACDEKLFRAVVKRIQADPSCYWIGMGDYAEFINTRDKRFEPEVLADWIEVADLVDLGRAQRDRFLDIVLPIAGKCLALVEGNHEVSIKRFSERAIYSEIVSAIKGRAKRPADELLGVDFSGWLRMTFARANDNRAKARFDWRLHHGNVGGRLAGAKALAMQRWLWSHQCDIALFGHSHNTFIQPEAVQVLDQAGRVGIKTRRGAYTGTFHSSFNEDGPPVYSERKAYLPLPVGGVEIELRPHTKAARKIRMVYES